MQYAFLGSLLTEVSRILACIGMEAARCGRWHDKDLTTNNQFLDTS